MERSNESIAWYNALPKEKQQLLDLWEEYDLNWNGPAWDDKPESVELECYTNAGEDMIISLEEISVDALEEYVNGFDISEEVSLWWENGKPGRGVPFDSQDEQVADYEEWLAELRDIIDASRQTKRKLSHQQQLEVDRLEAAAKKLEAVGLTFTYSPKRGFRYHKAA